MSTKTKSTVTPRQKIFSAVAFNQYRLLVRAENTDYDRLIKLTHGLSFLTGAMLGKNQGVQREILERLAAFAVGWAEVAGFSGDIFVIIHNERERQQGLLRAGKFSFTCASTVADPKRKLAVLMEEVGEVAKAMLERDEKKRAGNGELCTELIQVAAVCVAWLESLEGK